MTTHALINFLQFSGRLHRSLHSFDIPSFGRIGHPSKVQRPRSALYVPFCNAL